MTSRYPALTLVNLAHESAAFQEYTNFVVNTVGDHCMRLAVFEGVYHWHHHPNADELFLVLEGELLIDFLDRETCALGPNEMITIPAGVVHRTRAQRRTVNLCFEKLASETVIVDGPPPVS